MYALYIYDINIYTKVMNLRWILCNMTNSLHLNLHRITILCTRYVNSVYNLCQPVVHLVHHVHECVNKQSFSSFSSLFVGQPCCCSWLNRSFFSEIVHVCYFWWIIFLWRWNIWVRNIKLVPNKMSTGHCQSYTYVYGYDDLYTSLSVHVTLF